MLQNVEVRPRKGLLNLTGSAQFSTGDLSQTEKRDLQRAIASVVMTYNQLAGQSGTAGISIHENHLIGDNEIHEDRKIPRKSNERDYDYYHTLGVNFADNGRMMPHYHLEFGEPLTRHSVGAVLESLHQIGRQVLGRDILSQDDIAAVLALLPQGKPLPGIDARQILASRPLLPNEIASPEGRAQARDELESAFLALASQNTELASARPFLQNMHMNTFRPAEPLFECFSAGHTCVIDDLEKIEAHPEPGSNMRVDVSELLAIHHSLGVASRELGPYAGGTVEERRALAGRMSEGMAKIKLLLGPGATGPAPASD